MRAPFVRSVLTGEAVVGGIERRNETMPLCPTPPRASSATFKHPTARPKGPRRPIHRSKDEVRAASAPRGHRKDKYTIRRHPPPGAGEAVASRAHVCSHVGNAPHASLEARAPNNNGFVEQRQITACRQAYAAQNRGASTAQRALFQGQPLSARIARGPRAGNFRPLKATGGAVRRALVEVP